MLELLSLIVAFFARSCCDFSCFFGSRSAEALLLRDGAFLSMNFDTLATLSKFFVKGCGILELNCLETCADSGIFSTFWSTSSLAL